MRRILVRKPALAARLEAARELLGGQSTFRIEVERIRRVAIKLARGHALFELNEPLRSTPESCSISALDQLSAATRSGFEASTPTNIWPEVGSRAMSRLALSNNGRTGWVELQQGRYRYLTSWGAQTVVRFVMSEYLAGEISWRVGDG